MAVLTPHYLPFMRALDLFSWVCECFFTCLHRQYLANNNADGDGGGGANRPWMLGGKLKTSRNLSVQTESDKEIQLRKTGR